MARAIVRRRKSTSSRRSSLARAAKYRVREFTALRDLGNVYIQQLRTDEGLALVQQARISSNRNYPKEVSACLTAVGRVRRHKGDYQDAMQAFQQQLQIAQQGGDQPQVASTYGETGAVLSRAGTIPRST